MKKILTKFTLIFCFFLLNSNSLAFAKKEINNFNNNFENYNRILEVFNEKDEKIASFHVAIADNQAKKSYGLMNLKKLPKDYGMIFEFFPSIIVKMWMKNTFIPLDMIFIDADGEIATIKENTTPHSLKVISSEKSVRKVLEINAGQVKNHNIKTGFKVKIK